MVGDPPADVAKVRGLRQGEAHAGAEQTDGEVRPPHVDPLAKAGVVGGPLRPQRQPRLGAGVAAQVQQDLGEACAVRRPPGDPVHGGVAVERGEGREVGPVEPARRLGRQLVEVGRTWRQVEPVVAVHLGLPPASIGKQVGRQTTGLRAGAMGLGDSQRSLVERFGAHGERLTHVTGGGRLLIRRESEVAVAPNVGQQHLGGGDRTRVGQEHPDRGPPRVNRAHGGARRLLEPPCPLELSPRHGVRAQPSALELGVEGRLDGRPGAPTCSVNDLRRAGGRHGLSMTNNGDSGGIRETIPAVTRDGLEPAASAATLRPTPLRPARPSHTHRERPSRPRRSRRSQRGRQRPKSP
jgi:hypothetical protein